MPKLPTNFFLGVPAGKKEQGTGEETGLNSTEEEPAGKEGSRGLALGHSDDDTAPDDTDGRQVDGGFDLHQEHIGGDFEENVGDEE